jgi:hypothetical protein
MTNESAPAEGLPPSEQPAAAFPPPPAPGGTPQVSPYATPAPAGPGPIGQVRSTGLAILLYIVTLGIYGIFWYYKTHDEMKRHTGEGIGGGLAAVLGLFVSIVMVFLTPHEVGRVYERSGQKAPVSALTGLWILLPLAGAIIWFVKTNGALNAYWRSLGAR